MTVRVKICGITNLEDARLAVEAGADALGFIFYPRSPRAVSPEAARVIIRELPPFVTAVGVFVDEDRETLLWTQSEVGFQVFQLHGGESPELIESLPFPVVKGLRVGPDFDEGLISRYRCSAVLLDAYVRGEPGGTGKVFDWEVAKRCAERRPLVLAGGLKPGNVAEAVKKVRPYAVDTASGVEVEPGKKDPEKVRRFVFEAKAASAPESLSSIR